MAESVNEAEVIYGTTDGEILLLSVTVGTKAG